MTTNWAGIFFDCWLLGAWRSLVLGTNVLGGNLREFGPILRLPEGLVGFALWPAWVHYIASLCCDDWTLNNLTPCPTVLLEIGTQVAGKAPLTLSGTHLQVHFSPKQHLPHIGLSPHLKETSQLTTKNLASPLCKLWMGPPSSISIASYRAILTASLIFPAIHFSAVQSQNQWFSKILRLALSINW